MITKIGMAIIILTFVLSAMSPYILIFTIPVFLIGTVLLWFGKKKILTKTLWTVLPMILWYPAFALCMFLFGLIGTATAQKFDFVFPDGFKGNAIVVSNMPCGQRVMKKDGREQLFIPGNGVLLYQGKVKAGYINHKYYYQSSNGRLRLIPERANYMYFDSERTPPPTHVVGVWLGDFGTVTDSENGRTIKYSLMSLVIESKDSLNLHYDSQKERLFQNLKDSMIEGCR